MLLRIIQIWQVMLVNPSAEWMTVDDSQENELENKMF